MTRTGHACGKVILLGEHAVVYGVPALAVGIDLGARARAVPLDRGPSRLCVGGWNVSVQADETQDLARAYRALIEGAPGDGLAIGPHSVEVDADLPPGGGLGCSAAMAWERVFHGNPSGIDAAVAARGGCLLYRRGEALDPVRPRGSLQLCIGNTGMASSTKAMVEAIARLREQKRALVDKSFEAVGALVSSARFAIEAGDRFTLGRLMDLNQTLLAGLFVSTPEIERMCDLARDAGALGAKLTGAGGGGCVVALVSSQAVAEGVLSAWRAAGLDGFSACVAQEPRARMLESETVP